MTTIRREIEIEAAPADAQATWEHFIQWVLNGSRKLVCGEFACVSAVDSGNVSFEQGSTGTKVAFQLEVPDDELAPARDDLERHITHDLLVFKDYIEQGGADGGKPTSAQEIVLEHDADRKGDRPRHVKLSAENDTTFWRSHFPT